MSGRTALVSGVTRTFAPRAPGGTGSLCSSTGGQAQFVRGAYASAGGKSFICLASTYDKRGERRSRIVICFTPGNIVTTTRADMMYVVTEYGMVNLKGRSVAERALALISIAHPDFREGLEREAYENVVPCGFSF